MLEIQVTQHARMGHALLYASRNAGVAIAYHDLSNHIVWTHNFERYPATSTNPGMTGALGSKRMTEARERVATSGRPETFEFSLDESGAGVHWFDIWIDPDRGANGSVLGLVTTIVETTERKRREHSLNTLLREVSHRSRNLLAIAQSIAFQTGRYTDTIENFLTRFRGRLQALATSQDLVTSSNWRGAALRETIVSQMARYTPELSSALSIEGDDAYLNPNAALHVALAIHELTVNSVNHGALSRDGGKISITTRVSQDKDRSDRTLTLDWKETSSAMTKATDVSKRFGSITLERAVPSALNGKASLDIHEGHVHYSLVIPQENFEPA